ncbi:PREDICTED: probable carboxylesterase 16 [Nicotiana attenuata]|uniref:Carboxylesterase 11 n=1 Tax=Nicotiana attenuata TaxID=49451 RepID=A0A1J6IJ31_NICAT|nr:PREDICTED: probable carboxylesterase 16 [Nicotiana attenuata]OIS97742.1 putative carboxylesterase 11 [Nicotiana attenuata]
MPSLMVKVYSVLFKYNLKRRLQTLIESSTSDFLNDVVSRADETTATSNPSFSNNGVATKDLHIDPLTNLSLRIFLPQSSLRNSVSSDGAYGGYVPIYKNGNSCKKLPVILQFHGGAWVSGGIDTVSNDVFCRKLAKSCDAIVVSVGYRLAPESRYPAAFEDGVMAIKWLAKQANLAECGRSRMVNGEKGSGRRILDGFGASMVDPWLAAHLDPSRCVLLGVSCGANIANYVARYAVEAGKLLDPIKVVAQVLMYPFFIGNIPTHSEMKLANSYLYDKATCILAWKLFLPEAVFNLDHLAANPLVPGKDKLLDLKHMPPTLTVVAQHDWMRDRAIAYSKELRRVNIDAPLLDYKDSVHDFATLNVLQKTPKAQACLDDISIWVKKYISLRGNEFSY